MKKSGRIKHFSAWAGAAVLALGIVLLSSGNTAKALSPIFYTKTKIISNIPGAAQTYDADFVNPWGLSHSPSGPWWISDNGTGRSSVYADLGIPLLPPVVIPSPTAGGTGTPTGNVFNEVASTDPTAFVVKKGAASGSSNFIFATEDGLLAGWSKKVDGDNAIVTVNRSKATDPHGNAGAVYKGLAFGRVAAQPYVYATNFRFGTVEMFDRNFKLVRSFTDPQLTATCPTPGQCYAPFGIQNINGNLYVTFAQQDAQKHDDQSGPGKGFVDVFSTNGTLLKRLVSHGALNSPWGLARAPQDFGMFSNDLLVGNFGDGIINAYDPTTGNFRGTLLSAPAKPIQIDGLWGLAFGNNGLAGRTNELYFSAGINGEADGLFGKITQ